MATETPTTTILWRRVDRPGHESARLVSEGKQHLLLGAAVFVHETLPCRLDYRIVCSSAWETESAKVTGWVDNQEIDIEIAADSQRRWRLNGAEAPELDGCSDIDLSFSPSTNLLTLRRLKLQPGRREEIRVAWLRFPTFALEPLVQVYERTSADTYRYESSGGSFVAWLKVNEADFVVDYPGFWRAET